MAIGALTVVAFLGLAQGAGAQEGQRDLVRVAFPSGESSLTPYTFTSGYALMTLLYDTLTWRDVDGVPRPWLASSVRRSGRTVTVRLRPGARWHDGRPLTAADVVFTYRYVAERRHPRFTQQLRDIASVSARDSRTVVFRLRRASLGFEDQPLADVPILPRHLWENLAESARAPSGPPIGSGPYRMARRLEDGGYALTAVNDYVRGRPKVARIEVRIIPGEKAAFDSLTTAASAQRTDLVPFTRPAGSVLQRTERVKLDETVSYDGTMIEFNLQRRPFSRLRARRAVAQAIDLGKIAGALRGPAAMAPAERGMVHPASAWAPERDLQRFDANAARVAFAEQGFAPFEVLVSSRDAVRIEAARRVVAAVNRAGGQARLVERPPAEVQRALGRGGNPTTFQAAVVGMAALASYDPSFLRTFFETAAPLNDFGYSSARFEALDRRVAAATTRSARREAVADQLELLATDLPALPLFFGGTTFAYRNLSYSDWAGVRGSGVLDKRSFLPGPRTAATAAPVSSDLRDAAATDGGGGTSLIPFILGLAGLLLVGAAIWVVRGSGKNRAPGGRSR